MPWTTHPGLPGKVYIPEAPPAARKKHPCTTCYSCQWCDDNRCRVCRDECAQADEPFDQRCCRCKP